MYDYTEVFANCDKILDFIVSKGGRITRSDLTNILPKDTSTHVAIQHLIDDNCIQEYPKQSAFYDIISRGTQIQANGGYKEEFIRKRLAEEVKNKIDQSIIDTNSSVKQTNDSVKSTNYWTKRTAITGVIIAAVSCVYIALDYSKKEVTPDFSPINKQLEKTSKVLDSMLQVQKRIDSSLQQLANEKSRKR